MKRREFLAGTTLAGTAAALGLPAFAQEPLKVGFIYVGVPGDGGWTYQHDQGRQAVEQALGDKVTTTFIESVSEGPDAERVMRDLASQGHQLIFATSFGGIRPPARRTSSLRNGSRS